MIVRYSNFVYQNDKLTLLQLFHLHNRSAFQLISHTWFYSGLTPGSLFSGITIGGFRGPNVVSGIKAWSAACKAVPNPLYSGPIIIIIF